MTDLSADELAFLRGQAGLPLAARQRLASLGLIERDRFFGRCPYGSQDRETYRLTKAGRLAAQAIEARSDETGTGSARQGESAVGNADAPKVQP